MIDLDDIRQDIFDISKVPKVLYVYRGDTFELDLDLTISSSELNTIVLNCDGLPEATPLTLLESTNVSSKWHLVLNKTQTLILAPKNHNFTITIVRTDGTELTLYKGIMTVNNRVYSNYSNNYYVATLLKQTVPTIADNDYLIGTMWVNILTNQVYFLTSVVNDKAKWLDYGGLLDTIRIDERVNNIEEDVTQLDDEIIRVEQKVDTHTGNKNNPHAVTAEQVGLGKVNNTSDLEKPISTATQTALSNKVDKVSGKGLSSNDFTTTEKNKLSGIATGAQVNVGTNLSQGDRSTTTLRIDSSTGNNLILPAVTTSLAGLMTSTDKTRLDVLHSLLEEDTANNVVDSINEVLSIFNNYPEGADLVTALAGKVDKVSGKGLSTNDLTNTLKSNYDTAYGWGNHAVEGYLKSITKAMVEAVLTGTITSHNHNGVYEPANANIQAHISSTSNPHGVTKAQVGLGNVDNTSDLSKPISTAQQTALDNKVDKTSIVDNLTTNDANKPLSAKQGKTLQDNKVDKLLTIIGLDLQDNILIGEFRTALGNATQSVAGLLSAEDKTHLDVLVALLETSDGNNVVDTIGEILAIFQNYPEGADLVSALAGKVDKVSGKGLSTNDLTNTLKSNYDTAYTHSQTAHAPSNAQKNSDITKAEIEAKLIGTITSHSHALPAHTHTKSQITDFPTSMPPTAHSTDLLTSGTLGIARGGTGRTDGYAVGVVETRASVLTKIWTGTQAQYDAIGTKDANTLYFII